MTISARSRSWLAGALSRHTHGIRVAVPFAALLLAMLALAAPAGAVVTVVGGTTVGLQPRTEALGEGETGTFHNVEGNAVVHAANVYVDYWDPNHHLRPEWVAHIDTFMQQLEGDSLLLSNILSNQSTFRDRTNTGAKYQDVFKGSYSDTEKYPASENCTDPEPLEEGALTCVTDAQVRAHLQNWIAIHALPRGMNSIFDVILPPGATVCLDKASTHCSDYSSSPANSFCSYHSAINPDAAPEGDGNTVLYAALPWSAGTLTDAYFRPNIGAHAKGFLCQDGGWNPEKHREVREKEKEPSSAEVKEFEEATKEKKEEITKKREGEKAHQEEPNVEPKGEFSGWALADVEINQIAVEQANLITDPLLNAWHDNTGHESTDLCRDVFASTIGTEGKLGAELTGSVSINEETLAGTLANAQIGYNDPENPVRGYYLNNVYNPAQKACVGGVSLQPHFTSPNPVKNGEPVQFDGMESNVSLLDTAGYGPTGPAFAAYATFEWNFGDGTTATGYAPGAAPCEAPWVSPCAGSEFHTYAYGGTYHVTLTITDTGGNVARVEHSVAVAGPPPPTPPAPGGGNVAGHAGGGEGSASGNPVGGAQVNPILSASIASRSLRSVTHKGLVLRYSINEQVAGHAEVLITKALAHKLKLNGVPATGLPAGTPPEIVIGKAVLVTTKAGKGTLTIMLPGSVSAHLRKAHSVGVLVRLFVRNTASKTAATATVLSSATLN